MLRLHHLVLEDVEQRDEGLLLVSQNDKNAIELDRNVGKEVQDAVLELRTSVPPLSPDKRNRGENGLL